MFFFICPQMKKPLTVGLAILSLPELIYDIKILKSVARLPSHQRADEN